MTKRTIIASIFGATTIIAGGVTADILSQPSSITLDTATAKDIVWDKPTTDAGWAEDVKKENFDIKSSDVLQQMIAAHTDELAQLQKDDQEYIECPQCIVYEKKKALQDNNYSDPKVTLDQEAQNEATTDTNQRQWQIEKVEQSIERMNHELDLRTRGIVVPDKQNAGGTPTSVTALQKVAPDMVRHIDD